MAGGATVRVLIETCLNREPKRAISLIDRDKIAGESTIKQALVLEADETYNVRVMLGAKNRGRVRLKSQ